MFGLRKRKPIEAPAQVAGLRVRVSYRARRLGLRVDPKKGDIILTWPRGATEQMALRFIDKSRDWIENRRQKIKPPRPFSEGEKISIYGREFLITRREGRGVTRLEEDRLVVHGKPEYLSRRIRDFLKETARQMLEDKAAEKIERIGKKLSSIRVIDPKTRWGSCSPKGEMMFSWRLILMPPFVLDYVVAHEVAHCIHMNHGRKFWALCASLTENATTARRWLRAHGDMVMAYHA